MCTMCIRNAQFDGSFADIRKALASGQPLYFKFTKTGEVVSMQPHPDAGQIRDDENRKAVKVLVNGETRILAHDADGYQMLCGSRCN